MCARLQKKKGNMEGSDEFVGPTLLSGQVESGDADKSRYMSKSSPKLWDQQHKSSHWETHYKPRHIKQFTEARKETSSVVDFLV